MDDTAFKLNIIKQSVINAMILAESKTTGSLFPQITVAMLFLRKHTDTPNIAPANKAAGRKPTFWISTKFSSPLGKSGVIRYAAVKKMTAVIKAE